MQVDSRDSLENVESKWVGEIAEKCQGVRLVLVALKCDLREGTDSDGPEKTSEFIQYKEGLAVAKKIKVSKYSFQKNFNLLFFGGQITFLVLVLFANYYLFNKALRYLGM